MPSSILPTSEQEVNNLLEVQLSSLVLDWSKRVDEKQTVIDDVERKVEAANRQIEKLSKYITHWRRVEGETQEAQPSHRQCYTKAQSQLLQPYNTTSLGPSRSVRGKQQKRRQQQQVELPLPQQPSVKRSSHNNNSFVTDLQDTLQYGS